MMFAMMVAALSFTACGGDDEDDSPSGSSSFLVGTWSVTSGQGWFDDYIDDKPEYMQLKSDGTYVNVQFDDGLYITKGTWTVTDSELVLKEAEGNIKGTYTYKILNHTQSSMTLEMWGLTVNLTKVPDSTIEKYLSGNYDEDEISGDGNSSGYAFTITYDGELHKYEASYFHTFPDAAIWHNNRHEFFLGIAQPFGQIFWEFPFSVDASYFSVGYNNFDCSILWESFNGGVYDYDGKYTSGSATVIANNGKYISVRFSKYVLSLNSRNKSHTMEINGTINFIIE